MQEAGHAAAEHDQRGAEIRDEVKHASGDAPDARLIQVERQEGEGDYLVREIRRGSFSRTVSLPSGLEPDKAEATFENGVLKLRIPKAEETKPRQIRISPTIDGNATARSQNVEPSKT